MSSDTGSARSASHGESLGLEDLRTRKKSFEFQAFRTQLVRGSLFPIYNSDDFQNLSAAGNYCPDGFHYRIAFRGNIVDDDNAIAGEERTTDETTQPVRLLVRANPEEMERPVRSCLVVSRHNFRRYWDGPHREAANGSDIVGESLKHQISNLGERVGAVRQHSFHVKKVLARLP